MKVFLTFMILIINLQFWSKADDIRDFEIEGMSIGDSLLKNFNLNTINNSRKYTYDDKKFYSIDIWSDNFTKFDAMQFHLKKNDDNYIIYGFSGAITFGEISNFYPQSEQQCIKQKDLIIKDIENIFINANKDSQSGTGGLMEDDKVIRHDTYFTLENGSVWLQCATFSKNNKKKERLIDNLRLTILDMEFQNWMQSKAYN